VAEVPANPGKESVPVAPSWRQLWQAPALFVAVLLLVGGALTAILTAPKPNIVRMLDDAEQLIAAERYQQGLDVLNKKLLPYHNAGSLNPEQKREFHLLRARAIYLLQQSKNIELPENAKTICDEFADATRDGEQLEPKDKFYLANSEAVLGKFMQAVDLAHSLPAESRVDRGKIIKRVVEGMLAAPDYDPDSTTRLLGEFLLERELTVGDRGWALARQAELLMRQGLTTSAINKLLQTMPSLIGDLNRDELGELYLLLGKAYFQTDALAEAARQLNLATKLLLSSDPKHAQATIMLGRIAEQVGESPEDGHAQAKQKYAEVIERFPGSVTRLPALLGLGEVNAAMGNITESLAAYTELVQEMAGGKRSPDLSVGAVTESLMSRASARFDAGRMDEALDYATLVEKLYPTEEVPPETLLLIGMAHRHAAEDLYKGVDSSDAKIIELSRLDPATREQVRQHMVAAGRYFQKHADRININDNAGYGKSLWAAAECFDQAGDSEQAIPLFSNYARFFPGERQQPEARFRLGRAHQGRGDYATAEMIYKQLIEESEQQGGNSGPFGDASYVPLAQCYLMDGDPTNDSLAENLLNQVVQGHVGGTNAPQFRDALMELGRLRAAKGDFAGAIQLLDEAANRFPDWSQIDSVRYELAEAFRQDARAILKTLSEAMPDAKRQALTEARRERLGRAAELYELTRRALDARDPRRLSKLEQLQLRNSYFYIADCEFELKEYDSAIRHYDAARERYSSDPASLVAMVQIVNAYVEQKDMKRAATAQERAIRFYESLPISVWSDPNLPMGKEAWQHWLQSMNMLKPMNEAQVPDGN
jgi:tetratricopeptide (TPR) repeat protein